MSKIPSYVVIGRILAGLLLLAAMALLGLPDAAAAVACVAGIR